QGTFTNGQKVALALLALAQVNNPEGLASVGNGYFEATASSGGLQMGLAGTAGMGAVEGGVLENSNVDLTVELSNMIIAQRSFEANAREAAVVNSTLQTLAQLGQVSAA
ncbi:MAG TPA: flagellar hook-basal body complex protein, partial [bacterium]|nr:flagellar hook-basal body complex protein [bacterium]